MRVLPQNSLNRSSTLGSVGSGADETIAAESPAQATAENFHEVFVRYSKPVLSFIGAMIQDRSQAEELCQETFIRALRNLGSRTGRASLSTWLFGIARNVIREAVKSRYRDLRRAAALEDPAAGRPGTVSIGADQQLIAAELSRRITDSLGMLGEDQRLVFILRVLHEFKYEEIAGITGFSVSKLKSDLHRARLEMRQRLQPYLHGKNV